MFAFVVRKLLKNPWMTLCLLLGSVLVVAMMASVPIYTEGVLQRMLIRDLELYQESSGLYPGRYNLKVDFFFDEELEPEEALRPYRELAEIMSLQSIGSFVKLPVLSRTTELASDFLRARPRVQREEEPRERNIQLEGIRNIADHITILHGRLFSTELADGIIEVAATEQAMLELDLLLDEVYVVTNFIDEEAEPFLVRVVGVAGIREARDPFWYKYPSELRASLLMDFSLFQRLFLGEDLPRHIRAVWDYAFDYHALSMKACGRIIEAYAQQKQSLRGFSMPYLRLPALPILEKYKEREKRLKLTLWILQIPLLLMLIFFILMVSHLVVKHERDEIAVLKSRGSSSTQVFAGYLLESLVLALIALAVGPPLGLFLCRVIGLANGFLEFVQRTALPLELSLRAFSFSLFAVGIFMTAMLIPAFMASRTTIVLYKVEKTRRRKRPVLKMAILDALLLGVSGYGLYQYQTRQRMLELTGVPGAEMLIDPLLYVISTLFIVAAGLFFLLAFPYAVRLLYRLGRRVWPPVLYSSLVQVGRAESFEQFPMLFLILTLALGVNNASAARTLNTNIEEVIRYAQGADITLMTPWESNKPPEELGVPDVMGGGMGMNAAMSQDSEPIIYKEPPFEPFTRLEHVEAATKVFQRKNISVQVPDGTARSVSIQAVIPHEFGRVAWFRPDLLPAHWYAYLNVLSQDPRAVLLSSSFREEHDIEPGQSVWFSWEKQTYVEGIVYAFVDYWPAFNPIPTSRQAAAPKLLVANLDYVHAKMALEPYSVWLKKRPGATSEEIYEEIEGEGILLEDLQDADQQIIGARNDPMLQGTNGALTLNFLVTLGISFIGFLIYWIITVQERVLQFGLYRAMGMLRRKILGILAVEHLLVSGIPILAGIMIGGLAARLFVPLLQMTSSAAEQVPPFEVVAEAADYIKIYAVAAFMLASALTLLGIIASKIRIYEAVKLGEE